MFNFLKSQAIRLPSADFATFADFLFGFIKDLDVLNYFKEKFLYLQTLSAAEQQRAFVSFYFELEKTITEGDPEKILRNISREALRREIREKIKLEALDEVFGLIFEERKEQDLRLFEFCMNRLAEVAIKVASREEIQKTLAAAAKGTAGKNIAVGPDGVINFDKIHAELAQASDTQLLAIFSGWFKLLLVRAFIGGKIEQLMAQELVDEIERRGGFELASRLFGVLPQGLVQGDPWRFQSREDLHLMLAKSLAEIEQLKTDLKARSVDTDHLKTAMLNLVEDAQAAEGEAEKRAGELKSAIEQVAAFANIADHQRNTYMLLLSSIGEGVLVLDMAKKITITNKAAELIIGCPIADLVDSNFVDTVKILGPDGKVVGLEFIEKVYRDKQVFSVNNMLIVCAKRLDAISVPVVMVFSPIVDKHGEPQGIIITLRDVREERALEEARISFISIASHQLRTPLTSMRWFAEMLMDGDVGALTEDQRHYLERIYQGTDRMISLVNLLLQIARVEAGRVKITPTPSDLKVVTSGVLITLKAILDAKAQKVEIVTPEPVPIITMDQDVVWQVIQNLLSNASRYAPERSTITVRIISKDGNLVYSVEDKGIGIPESAKGRIFEKFFRAENALKAVPEGSGLGLSLVKLLVEGWGGKIWFDSKEGKGTTFYFTIPLAGMNAKEGEVGIMV